MKRRIFASLALVACLPVPCGAAGSSGSTRPGPGGLDGLHEQQGATEVFTLESLAGRKAGDNRVFMDYAAGGKSRWNQDWPGRVDLTGVAWNTARTATAITPRHVVMASHFALKSGDRVVFHDRTGTPHKRKIKRVVPLWKRDVWVDVAVGLLDSPLPAAIKTYPLLAPRADYAERLTGASALIINQKRRVYIHEVRYVQDRQLMFGYAPEFDPSMHKKLIPGDSGDPSFLIVRGEPVLLETRSNGGKGSGYFYSTPICFNAVEKAVRDLDPKYKIQTRTLDATFLRGATARRAKREEYQMWNLDGSRRKDPNADQEAQNPPAQQPPVAKPPGPNIPPPDPKRPRVKRVPKPRR